MKIGADLLKVRQNIKRNVRECILYLFIFLDFVYDPLRKRGCANGKVSRKGNRDIAGEEVRYRVIVFGK